jgi:hypothetical protein
VTVWPGGKPGTVTIEIAGRLSRLLGADVFPSARASGGSLVAGGRFRQSPRPDSGLFRLHRTG